VNVRLDLGLLSGLLALGSAPGPPPRTPAPVSDSLTSLREVSGLRVLQRLNRANDLVVVSLYLLGGTRQLTERTAGIEELLLDAAAQGSEHFPGDQGQRAMARAGAVEVIAPDPDWTVFGFIVLRQDLDSTWNVFADRLLRPTLSAEAVRRAREEMLTTVRRRYSDPDERIRVIANKSTFKDHPYALDPQGTEESLAQITASDLSDYARTQMVTSRMLLVVVGNVGTARVDSLVTATIGRLPHGSYAWTLPPSVPRQKQSRWLIEGRQLPTNYILGYFTGPDASSNDYAAFRVATGLLSSRLTEAIRIEHSLSYAVYAPFLERAVGVGGLYASTPKPEEVLPLMYQQIRSLLDEPIDGWVLHRFINTHRVEYVARNGSDEEQADFLARAQLYLGDYRQSGRYMQQLHRVSPEDVMRVADRYMRSIQWAYIGDIARMEGHW